MQEIKVKTFADLMNGHFYAEIICLYTGKVVRKLSQAAGKVQIDFTAGPILSLPLNTPITYEPWFMDRGSLLFTHDEMPGKTLKICTEADTIRFEDGSKWSVSPSKS